jgi:hypothetical protein
MAWAGRPTAEVTRTGIPAHVAIALAAVEVVWRWFAANNTTLS